MFVFCSSAYQRLSSEWLKLQNCLCVNIFVFELTNVFGEICYWRYRLYQRPTSRSAEHQIYIFKYYCWRENEFICFFFIIGNAPENQKFNRKIVCRIVNIYFPIGSGLRGGRKGRPLPSTTAWKFNFVILFFST